MFASLFSGFSKRAYLLIVFLFFFVFYIFHVQTLSEEICVFICYFGLVSLFSFYIMTNAIKSLQKTWYLWFFQDLDLSNLALIYMYNGLFILFKNKEAFISSFIFNFFSLCYTLSVQSKVFLYSFEKFLSNLLCIYLGFGLNRITCLNYNNTFFKQILTK